MKIHHCNFVTVDENIHGVKEVCTECKKTIITRVDSKGRIDNRKWLKEHVRDTAQPTGATEKIFKQYYGTKNNKPT